MMVLIVGVSSSNYATKMQETKINLEQVMKESDQQVRSWEKVETALRI